MQQLGKLMEAGGYYDGSRIFTWLADLCGLSVDLVNFLITQVLALLLAYIFRLYLGPTKVSASVRHAFGLVFGLFFGYFCFGQQAIHIAGLPAVCYIVIRTQNPQIVQRLVMVVALAYLSCIHIHRQYYDYTSYSLDITGPLMIITQKVTSLAFSIHDGLTREEKDLTKSQQYHAVQKLPSALEYFSFLLHFEGVLTGPLVFYKDYIEFIEGYHILKHAPATNGNIEKSGKQIVHEPSPVKAVVKKIIASAICAYIYIKCVTVYPIKQMTDDDFIENSSSLYKLWFIMMATTGIRFKYYFAWLLSDAICNTASLGFNGYDKDGIAKWDMISNIHVISFELGTNFRDCINNWNVGTNRWLRSIVYERAPKKYGTLLTFALSALWHGFYPGYYITFATGALIVMAARHARKLFRHRFQKTAFTRNSYDILTCLLTRIFMGYATFPFVILEFQASLRMYLKFYMCLHLVALVTIYILPKLIKGERRPQHTTSTTNSIGVHSNNNINNNNINMTKPTLENNKKTSVNENNTTNNNNIIDKDNVIDGVQMLLRSKTERGVNVNNTLNNNDNVDKEFNNGNRNIEEDVIVVDTNLSNMIKEKIEMETRNIEDLIDKTVTGIVELKDDLMRMNDNTDMYNIDSNNIGVGLRKRNHLTENNTNTKENGNVVDAFLKKEIDAINAAVHQVKLPAVLSNGHAK